MRTLLILMLSVFCAAVYAGDVDPLEGKRIGVLGDSYVKNHKRPVEETWHYKMAKRHHMTYYNYGRNGNCLSIDLVKWGKAMCSRYKEMTDSLDYVVVIAGHNDAVNLDSMGIGTYKERLGELCRGLIDKYPKARIYFFTPWCHDNPAFLQVVDATLEVCGSYGIPVFDAYRNSNIFARSDRFRKIYFQGGVRDHAHLNAAGHDRFLPIAEKFIIEH